MPFLVTLADIRDVFIIVYGTLGILFFLIASFATFFLYRAVRSVLGSVNSILDDSVKPTVNSIRDAAETIRGTTDFVGRTAVTPIVRTYGAFAGVRKGLGVLGGLRRRGR